MATEDQPTMATEDQPTMATEDQSAKQEDTDESADIFAHWPSDTAAEDERGDESADDAEESTEESDDDSESEDTEETEGEGEDEDEDEDAEDDEESDDGGESEESEDDESEDQPDEVAAKRIEQIRNEEKRAKAALAKERNELATERQQLDEYKQQVTEFQRLRRRASADPVTVLEHLGVDVAEFEDVSRQLYLHAKGAEKPEYREKAAELRRLRSNTTEVQELRDEIKQLRQEREQERQQAEQQRLVDEYVGSVKSTVNGKTPLVSRLIKGDPDLAQQQIIEAAERLYQKEGATPDPADVLAEIERSEAKRLKALGIDPKLVGKKKTSTKTKTKKKAAKTKQATSKNEKPPPQDDDAELDEREKLLQGMPWGDDA